MRDNYQLVTMKRLPMPDFYRMNDLEKSKYWLDYIRNFDDVKNNYQDLVFLLPEVNGKNLDDLPMFHIHWDEIYDYRCVKLDSVFYKSILSVIWPVIELGGKYLESYFGVNLKNYTNIQLSCGFIYDEIVKELCKSSPLNMGAGMSPWTKLIGVSIFTAVVITCVNYALKKLFGDVEDEKSQMISNNIINFINQLQNPPSLNTNTDQGGVPGIPQNSTMNNMGGIGDMLNMFLSGGGNNNGMMDMLNMMMGGNNNNPSGNAPRKRRRRKPRA